MQQEMLLIVLLISLWKVCHLKLNFYSEAYSTVTCRQFVCIMVEMMRCPSHYSYQRGMIVSQLDGITCTIKLVKIINQNRSSDLVPSDWIFLHFVNTFYLINLLDISLLILRQMRQVRVPCRPCLSSVRPRNFQNPILFMTLRNARNSMRVTYFTSEKARIVVISVFSYRIHLHQGS